MKRKEHIMEFNKLVSGHNDLEFSVNDAFLKEMGIEEDYQADVTAYVSVRKSDNMYEVSAHLKGTAGLTCDICLDEFPMPVDSHFDFRIKVSEFEKYDDDEIVYITPAAIDFDLSQFLFDSFMLSFPIRKTCSLAGKPCNEEVIRKLEKLKPEEHNEEDGEDSSDPRWDKLKGIINPN